MKAVLLCLSFLCFYDEAQSNNPYSNSNKKFADSLPPGVYDPLGVTVAGGGGKGSAANQFDNAVDVYVDERNNVYVADKNNHRIQKWAPGASAGITVAGGNGPGSAPNQLAFPNSVYVTGNGDIYIADQANNRVQKWSAGTAVGITVAGGNGYGAAANQLALPYDVCVNDSGLYISDQDNNRIQFWAIGARAGKTVAGGNGAGYAANQLYKPKRLTVSPHTMYIVDGGNARIQLWIRSYGSAITELGSGDPYNAAQQELGLADVFVDERANLFYLETGNHQVRQHQNEPSRWKTIGGGNGRGSTADKLDSPTGFFVNQFKVVYVADAANNRIQKFEIPPNNGYYASALTIPSFYPNSFFVDSAASVYSTSRDSKVTKVAAGSVRGEYIGPFGNGRPANMLNNPSDIFVDAKGAVYIADMFNHRIQRWQPGDTVARTVAGGRGFGSRASQLFRPSGVFVDAKGNIYVADQSNFRIQKWAPGDTAGITVAGGRGRGAATNQIGTIEDVYVDPGGNIYFADLVNHRVQKWAPGDSVGTTVAGGNGAGKAANQLNYPMSVFVDREGSLYISELFNPRVQKWLRGASSGETVAGGSGGGESYEMGGNENVYVDAAGSIYVLEDNSYRINKFVKKDQLNTGLNFSLSNCDEKTFIQWKVPEDSFPSSINIPKNIDPAKGTLNFIAALNGHGYYASTKLYAWPKAAAIAGAVGGAIAPSHLVTFSSANENELIYNYIKQTRHAPWIGLFNFGITGLFHWSNNEPNTFSNWATGEPNNAGGNIFNMKEPFVRMSDIDGKWNDQRDDSLTFIAEFDRPLVSSKQIAGPANGSMQGLGVYEVCYEKLNTLTGLRDTSCFSITVRCPSRTVFNNTSTMAIVIADEVGSESLKVVLSPNPSNSYFKLQVTGFETANHARLSITDIAGREVQVISNQPVNQVIQFGENLRRGVYILTVSQGNHRIVKKIIKQ